MHNPSSTDYYSGRDRWIRDKKKFRLSMIITAVLTLLSIRYPGTRPLYEEALLAIRLPVSVPLPGGGQLTYSGLIFLGVGLWALFLIWDSLSTHRILFCLMLIWLLPVLGKAALAGYQMIIPSGVYTLTVDQDQTNCQYQLKDGKAIGSCFFVVTNQSRGSVRAEQTARIWYGSPEENQEISVSFGSVELKPHEKQYYAPEFSAEIPKPQDRDLTGSGYAGLSVAGRGFILTMNDGKHTRVWGD